MTTALGKRLSFEYSLLCIWEIEAEELRNLGSPHLLPLLPFMKDASLPQIYDAFERIEAMEEDRPKREIRASLVGTAKLKLESINWLKHVGGKAALMGTDIFEEIIQEGAERERRSFLTAQLRERFGKKIERYLKKLATLDGPTLLALGTKIATIRDDEAFLAELRKVLAER